MGRTSGHARMRADGGKIVTIFQTSQLITSYSPNEKNVGRVWWVCFCRHRSSFVCIKGIDVPMPISSAKWKQTRSWTPQVDLVLVVSQFGNQPNHAPLDKISFMLIFKPHYSPEGFHHVNWWFHKKFPLIWISVFPFPFEHEACGDRYCCPTQQTVASPRAILTALRRQANGTDTGKTPDEKE